MFALNFNIIYLFEFFVLVKTVKTNEGRKVIMCD
jgi:hypothetical protein